MAGEIKRTKGGQFTKGQSGNPKGRATSASTQLRRQLADHGPAMVEKAVELALAGDPAALKLCLDRIAPPLKPSAAPISVDLPESGSLAGTARAILDATADGKVPGDLAAQLIGAVGTVAKVVELDELEERLAALEEADQ